jgi:hypothetical protein
MSKKIERIADAMFAAAAKSGHEPMDRSDPLWVDMARAAVGELREPTPEMVAAVAPGVDLAGPEDFAIARAAVDLLPPNEHPDIADILAAIACDFRGMVDAALNPPPAKSQ